MTERLTSGGLVIETKTHEGAITYIEARKTADDYEALARQEAEFRYAAVVLFDEQRHSAEHLERTIAGLERKPAYDQVIIVDVTGLDGSNGVAPPPGRSAVPNSTSRGSRGSPRKAAPNDSGGHGLPASRGTEESDPEAKEPGSIHSCQPPPYHRTYRTPTQYSSSI